MVTPETIAVLHAAYDAYNDGDLDRLIGLYSEDAVMVTAVLGQTHRGPVEIRKSFEEFFDVVETPRTEPLEFIEEGEAVVVPVRIMGRLRHTGITDDVMPWEMTHAFLVRDGKIVWNYICVERDEAVVAARGTETS